MSLDASLGIAIEEKALRKGDNSQRESGDRGDAAKGDFIDDRSFDNQFVDSFLGQRSVSSRQTYTPIIIADDDVDNFSVPIAPGKPERSPAPTRSKSANFSASLHSKTEVSFTFIGYMRYI